MKLSTELCFIFRSAHNVLYFPMHAKYSIIVTCIYAPRFATLALVKSVGGAYMRDQTFYLVYTPPLLRPRLDIDIGTL